MITISLCMIVKDEEAVLERCLRSVVCAMDEIIIVDTGSTDSTREIAEQFTDNVYDFPWQNDFALARNFAFSKATKNYCMWLDADDVMPEAELDKLIALKGTLLPEVDIVTMRYHTHFDAHGYPILTSMRERLIRRGHAGYWEGAVHECIPLTGRVQHEPIAVHHKKMGDSGDRNLNIYREKLKRGEDFSPRETYYFAREWMDHGVHENALEWFAKFLNEGRGWVEDNIGACLGIAHCLKHLNRSDERKRFLMQSFLYDLPRAEILCEIAGDERDAGNLSRAIYWYELALNASGRQTFGFTHNDQYGYIPAIELCVCHAQLGNIEKAIEYNERAAAFKPDAEAVRHNRAYFEGLKKEMPAE